MTSLASAKGPSVTLGFPPANETRAPIDGGCRPSSASSTPAFWRDSLYFIIAATALASGVVPGAAFSYPFGIISIMNRIIVSPILTSSKTQWDRHVHQVFLRVFLDGRHADPRSCKMAILLEWIGRGEWI